MTIEELNEKYSQMCDSNEDCDACKYNRENCLLYFGYRQGREELKKQYAEIEIGIKNEDARKIRADVIYEIKNIIANYHAHIEDDAMADIFNDLEQLNSK